MSKAGLFKGFAAALSLISFSCVASAQDILKLAIGQGGGWEQSISELGQRAGIFKKHGLVLEIMYTQGSGESLQSVISGSVDIGGGLGTHSVLGAFAKGAPVRAIGASFTSADDQFYYVAADSPIRDIREAGGKTIAISTTGSSSHMFALALAKHFAVDLKPQATGNYASTLTQTVTKQVDIGFSQAPFNLNAVEEGKIRIIAMGRDVPELRAQTCRLLIANAATLERRREAFARFIRAYRETLDWMYADPAAMTAYAAWSGLPERIARRATEFQKKEHLDPTRLSGLEMIIADAVKFKYLAAPLSEAQVKEVIQYPSAGR